VFFSLSRKNKRAIEIHASRETWRTRAVKRAPKIIGDFRHRHEGVHHVLRVTRDAYISPTLSLEIAHGLGAKNEPMRSYKYPTSLQVKPIQTLNTPFELKSIEEENPDAKEH